MQAVKTRHQGNATVITLPAALRVPENKEFYVRLNDDDSITLIPKMPPVFELFASQDLSIYQPDEWADEDPRGAEVI